MGCKSENYGVDEETDFSLLVGWMQQKKWRKETKTAMKSKKRDYPQPEGPSENRV